MEIIIIMLTGFILFIAEGELYRRMWSKELNAGVKITPVSAYVGDRCTLEVTLSNRKLLPLPWLWVKLHISSSLQFADTTKATGDYVYRNALFCIMGWQEIKRTLAFKCTKRGYYPVRSFEIIGTSILFNGKHSISFPTPCAVTVYPSLLNKAELEGLLSRLDGTIAHCGWINPDPFEFSGIREYSSSDSFRDINFKASAHANTLMTNTHNPTIKGEITLILCFKLLKERFEEERFEYAISLAATLADYYIEQGFSIALYCNGEDETTGNLIRISSGIGGGQLNHIYECLARVSYRHCKDVDILIPDTISSSFAVFISPTVDMPILDLYNKIMENHAAAKWLFPVMDFDAPRTAPPADTAEIVCVPPSRSLP